MNRFQLAREYAARNDTTVFDLARTGRVARPCACRHEECDGIQIVELCASIREDTANGPRWCSLPRYHFWRGHQWTRDYIDEEEWANHGEPLHPGEVAQEVRRLTELQAQVDRTAVVGDLAKVVDALNKRIEHLERRREVGCTKMCTYDDGKRDHWLEGCPPMFSPPNRGYI